MTDTETTITIPRSWIIGFCVGGAAVGFGAAFVVGPLVEWLISIADGAPGPLRIAARLPLAWAIPVLTLAGAAVGFWLTREWRKEVSVVTVSASGVTIESGSTRQHVDRQRIGGIFTDGKDLIVTDSCLAARPTPCSQSGNRMPSRGSAIRGRAPQTPTRAPGSPGLMAATPWMDASMASYERASAPSPINDWAQPRMSATNCDPSALSCATAITLSNTERSPASEGPIRWQGRGDQRSELQPACFARVLAMRDFTEP
jgi:hypothetical protein